MDIWPLDVVCDERHARQLFNYDKDFKENADIQNRLAFYCYL
jgi:hypothetical protein